MTTPVLYPSGVLDDREGLTTEEREEFGRLHREVLRQEKEIL
jgi:hypothetical protein